MYFAQKHTFMGIMQQSVFDTKLYGYLRQFILFAESSQETHLPLVLHNAYIFLFKHNHKRELLK